jgi:integral membrane sensor domain MASE1
MRKISIFGFFLILMTAALRLGDIFAILVLSLVFLVLYDLAEQLDGDDQ